MADMPLLVAGFNQAKKVGKPKKPRGGEPKMSGHTQVGEQAMGAMNTKPPTHFQRQKSMAREEMLHATRRYVAGEISHKQHAAIHARARKVMRTKY